jgi:hypothetical protein
MLSNQSGKPKSKSNNLQSQRDSVKYFDARHFYNDLDKQDDYYLMVGSNGGENKFVKKDTIKNGKLY